MQKRQAANRVFEQYSAQQNLSAVPDEAEINVKSGSLGDSEVLDGAVEAFGEDMDDYSDQQAIASAGAPSPERSRTRDRSTLRRSSGPSGYGHHQASPAKKTSKQVTMNDIKSSEELQLEKDPIQVRETGVWPFKRVIIPPNAYVVHTRLNKKQPVTLGLGQSFRFDPNRDSYLVAPAAMQTIGVVANCISKEKQGINVLAYVQWQIDDFSIAYRRLDFSNSADPLGIVNAQLSEQAEAAIKDKISTMGVEEVLSDKAPVIEELTTRLKAVSEGRNTGDGEDGLGIKIVTVQIREAIVSSQSLWSNLQSPFRHEKEKAAQLSELQMQQEIQTKELEAHKSTETRNAEAEYEIELIKEAKATEGIELRLHEASKRQQKEQEAAHKRISLEEKTELARRESEQRIQVQEHKFAQEGELERIRQAQEKLLEQSKLESAARQQQKAQEVEEQIVLLKEAARLLVEQSQTEIENLKHEQALKERESVVDLIIQAQRDLMEKKILLAKLERDKDEGISRAELDKATRLAQVEAREAEAKLQRYQQETRNLISQNEIMRQFVEQIPAIAEKLPKIKELKVLQTSGSENAVVDGMISFLAKILMTADTLGIAPKQNQGEGSASAS